MGSIRTQKALNITGRKAPGVIPEAAIRTGSLAAVGEKAGGLYTSDAFSGII